VIFKSISGFLVFFISPTVLLLYNVQRLMMKLRILIQRLSSEMTVGCGRYPSIGVHKCQASGCPGE